MIVLFACTGSLNAVLILLTGWKGVLGAALALPGLLALVTLAWVLCPYDPSWRSGLRWSVLWGSTVSVTAASLGSLLLAAPVVLSGLDPTALLAVVGAPLSEELAKFAGLLVLMKRCRIDGIVHAVVYAVLIAAGFAFVENALYAASAFNESASAGVATVAIRSLMRPFAHPFFTGLSAIGVGLAVRLDRPHLTWATLPVGMAAHAMFNGSMLAPVPFGILAGPLLFVAFTTALILTFSISSKERASLTTSPPPPGIDLPDWTLVSRPSAHRALRERLAGVELVHYEQWHQVAIRRGLLTARMNPSRLLAERGQSLDRELVWYHRDWALPRPQSLEIWPTCPPASPPVAPRVPE